MFPVAGRIIAREKDPYFSNVSVLLHFDGPNGSTSFVDSGPIGHTSFSALSSATITTSESKFGQGSLDASEAARGIRSSSHASFGMGTGDFTVEAWIKPIIYFTSSNVIISLRSGSGSSSEANNVLALDGSGRLRWSDGASWLGSNNGGLQTGQWSHVAVTRSSGTIRLFENGVLRYSASRTNNLGSSRPLAIGRFNDDGSSGLRCYIDEVRITKGVARYTDNFVVPNKPFPNK